MPFSKFITPFIYIIIIHSTFAYGQTDSTTDAQEHSYLKTLLNEGYRNPDLYLKLSKTASSQPESLCYARLGLLLAPRNTSLKQQVDSIREVLKIKELGIATEKSANPSPNLFIVRNILPKHELILLLLIVGSLSLTLSALRYSLKISNRYKLAQNILHFSALFLFVQIFLVAKTKDGRFRILSSLEDLSKSEGVVLSEVNVYSSPSQDSQQVSILKPSWEINLYPREESEPWILVETNDKRRGWINGLDGICAITE